MAQVQQLTKKAKAKAQRLRISYAKKRDARLLDGTWKREIGLASYRWVAVIMKTGSRRVAHSKKWVVEGKPARKNLLELL